MVKRCSDGAKQDHESVEVPSDHRHQHVLLTDSDYHSLLRPRPSLLPGVSSLSSSCRHQWPVAVVFCAVQLWHLWPSEPFNIVLINQSINQEIFKVA